jgi:hypothetical protein
MTVMVVDVGGGTTDVTVHNCQDVGGKAVLAEAVTAEGDICGGVMADDAFRWVTQDPAFEGVVYISCLLQAVDCQPWCLHTYTCYQEVLSQQGGSNEL